MKKRFLLASIGILTAISLVGCQSEYEKRLETIQNKAVELNTNIGIDTSNGNSDPSTNGLETLDPSVFGGGNLKEITPSSAPNAENTTTPTTNETNSTPTPPQQEQEEETPNESNIGFTGNTSVSTYSKEMSLYYKEYQSEKNNLLKNIQEFKSSDFGDMAKQKLASALNITINAATTKNDLLNEMKIPDEYTAFNEEFSKLLNAEINLAQKYLIYLQNPNDELGKTIDELIIQFNENGENLKSLYEKTF